MRTIIQLLLCATLLNASQFLIMTEDLKPYNYLENNQLIGISTEVVEEVLKKLDYSEEKILVYPWSRAIRVLDNDPKAILFSMSYTKERAQKYKFACPLSKVEIYLFTKKENAKAIKEFKELSSLKLGVIQDFGAHKYLIQEGLSNFDFSPSTHIMAQKLLSGKIDAFPSAPFAIYSLEMDTTQIEQTKIKLYETDLCIAFSQSISNEEVKKWEDALMQIHQSGQYQEIYNKYMQNIKP